MINEIINSYWLLASFLSIPLFIGFLKNEDIKIIEFLLCYFLTFTIGAILKSVTAVPRPFIHDPQTLGITTNIPATYSFPSLHTALITIFAWALATVIPRLSWLGFAIALFIGFSRVYLGVHYYTDIVAGFLIATFIFWGVYVLFNAQKFLPKKSDPNIRRKLMHLIYGVILAGLIQYNILDVYHIGLITLIAGIIVIASHYVVPKNISPFVLYFERQKAPKYLGVGPFFFLISAFVATLVFRKEIAIASILNLAIGDSINALLGYFWQTESKMVKIIPEKFLNHKKRIGASLSASFATTLVALNFVSPQQAIAGSLVTLVLEYSEPEINGRKIDDNLIIPAASGLLMYLF